MRCLSVLFSSIKTAKVKCIAWKVEVFVITLNDGIVAAARVEWSREIQYRKLFHDFVLLSELALVVAMGRGMFISIVAFSFGEGTWLLIYQHTSTSSESTLRSPFLSSAMLCGSFCPPVGPGCCCCRALAQRGSITSLSPPMHPIVYIMEPLVSS